MGEDFAGQRDVADEIFCKMAPPKPSRKQAHHTAVASMRTYYNCSGGCFHGDCRVTMADGSARPLRSVRRGDRVRTGSGTAATVRCVTRTPAPTSDGVSKMLLVQLPGTQLLATPWHPVKLPRKSGAKGDERLWAFPSDVSNVQPMACDAVFNLLLDSGSSMMIEGVECIALGHGLTGPVVGHAYYSSQRVAEDLAVMPGWKTGIVDLRPEHLLRDPKTGKVVAIRPSKGPTRHNVKEARKALIAEAVNAAEEITYGRMATAAVC